MASEAEDAATLCLLPKVHKDPKPGGHPASRPVVAAASGMSSRAGDMVSDLLEPLVYLTTPRLEDKSTEEVIAQLEEAEVALKQQKETRAMAASLDVAALYPSLDQEQSSALVGRFVEMSVTEVEGVDWESAQTMIASHWTQERGGC